jgi:Tol biopolymer transport system component
VTATIDRLRAALSGRYDVSKEIGVGGMATVFLGHDLKHDRDVAIKVLHPDLGAALGSERFLSEIKTTAKLQHPHILPLLDSGEADSLLYYVMPFVVGESLRARIDRERQLPINDAVRITKEVASALDYAHRHGVIHRDIKPENILLHDGQALVADFGLALAVSAAGGGRLTQTGLSLGTPQYMSPEQAVGERTIDARSDIYSLGAVTYEMITGDPPFAGSTVQAIVSKIMTERPTPISRLRETVPETVEDAVMIALSKLPADRFATAAEFANALTTHVAGFTREHIVDREGAGRRRTDFFRQRGVLALTALSALLLIAALWGWLRPQPPRQTVRYVLPFDSAQALNGAVSRIALSPDGMTLVFAGGPDAKLFVRQRSALTATALPGTDGARAPFFSPDGKTVGYSTADYVIKTVSLQGGAPITIADSIVGQSGGNWGADGFIYISSKIGTSIVRVAGIPGAVPKSVTTLDTAAAEVFHRLPYPLPNKKGVLFTVYYGPISGRGSAIAVQNFATGKHTILADGLVARYSPSGHLLYVSSNGNLMAAPFDQDKMVMTGAPFAVGEGVHTGLVGAADLAVSNDGTLMYTQGTAQSNFELVWVGRDGKATPVDSSWQGAFGYPAISPDGKKLAIGLGSVFGQTGDIWVKQLDTGPALKLTFGAQLNSWPSWTPDGRFITYYSRTGVIGGQTDLFTKRSDGSSQPVIQLPSKLSALESLWSPDGKWLVFRTGTTIRHIYAIRPGVDSTPITITTSPSSEVMPTFSPDGHWLAYQSNESGSGEIFVVPFPNSTSAKWPVSAKGGSSPRWSHSGKEIFYLDGAGNMVAASVSTNPTFSLGATKILFRASPYIASPGAHHQYDISHDDQRFLMIRPVGSSVPDKLVVVDNWFDELKQKSR